MKRTNEVKFKWLHTSRRLLNHLFSPNCTLEWTLPSPPPGWGREEGEGSCRGRWWRPVRDCFTLGWMGPRGSRSATKYLLTFWHCPLTTHRCLSPSHRPRQPLSPASIAISTSIRQLHFPHWTGSYSRMRLDRKRTTATQKFRAWHVREMVFIKFRSTRVFVTINENQL